MKATITNMRERVDLARMHVASSMRAIEIERSNPQVEELYQQLRGKLDAYNAVLDALNGNSVMLSIEYRDPNKAFAVLDA